MVRIRQRAKLLVTLLVVVVGVLPTQASQLMKTLLSVTAPPVLTYSGTTSGTVDLQGDPYATFVTAGTWTITVNRSVNGTVTAISGGGGGAGTGDGVHGGAGGGSGAAERGQTLTLYAGKTYTLVVGVGGWSSGAIQGGLTSFENTTDGITLVLLQGAGTPAFDVYTPLSAAVATTASSPINGAVGGTGGNTGNGGDGGDTAYAGGGGGGGNGIDGSTGGHGGSGASGAGNPSGAGYGGSGAGRSWNGSSVISGRGGGGAPASGGANGGQGTAGGFEFSFTGVA